ncbi:hypothetical protein [Robertmurraya andreesenii]|uniref:Uncharacterized protein n=1 Tax=Anoxybacillus andreesenii TaxID=1325932 RepID=A0ABT9V191_9BACL|nr:hypothetical protein [Robertmurraya andreesenii]MDQ0154709.1 hypothetical protein [Robertmurraya andreesenii]
MTGLNFAVKANICKLIGEETPYDKRDKIEEYLSELNKTDIPIELILISSWRAILKEISTNQISPEQGQQLIKWIFKRDNKN